MNLNADLGEGSGTDEAILGFVDSANIACGAHAGSISIAIATAWRCRELGVEVGAHPSYEDRGGFGRIEKSMSAREIEALVGFQVAGLAAVAPIAYVKPHGALYHRCQRDPDAADAVVRVAQKHGVGVVCQEGFELAVAAGRAGIEVHREGFADRLLLPDGSLAPRSHPGAVLSATEAADQALKLVRSDRFDTICVHGDTPGAPAVAAAVRQALTEAGVKTAPLRPRE
jgi:5-oxoprolinase (ATP-hydrolysing) subunit A